jgi:hypothetical protein
VRRFDSFPYAGEADMLECRLVELETVPDLTHIIVEADVTHEGSAKPYHYPDHADRFEKWADRILYVQASDLPLSPDGWTREHAQREWVRSALTELRAEPDDVLMHGDVDEIPTVLVASHASPPGIAVCLQRFHPFAVDWRHPMFWPGTTIAKVRNVAKIAALRDARLSTVSMQLPDAGWHFSWVGSPEQRQRKIASFVHQEIRSTWEDRLEDCYAGALHVDGADLAPVEVDDEWPRWIIEGHAPAGWFRPKVTGPRPDVAPAPILGRFSK